MTPWTLDSRLTPELSLPSAQDTSALGSDSQTVRVRYDLILEEPQIGSRMIFLSRRCQVLRVELAGFVLSCLTPMSVVTADEIAVAVATNFRPALEALAPEFVAATGHTIAVTAASTGQLYAQIVNGAPFDVLLAADQERPRLLVEMQLGVAPSLFTYAAGRLALWSGDPDRIDTGSLSGLGQAEFRWLALAEPAVAPYGAAAWQVLQKVGVLPAIEARLVKGQNAAQAFAMIETGNAELGLVPLALALAYSGEASYFVVPAEMHEPIRQDALLLARGDGKRAARDFLDWLRLPSTAALIETFGYGSPISGE